MKKILFIAAASAVLGIAGMASAEPAPRHAADHGHDANQAVDQGRTCPHNTNDNGGTRSGVGAMPGMSGKDASGMLANGHHMMGSDNHAMADTDMRNCAHMMKRSASGSTASAPPPSGKQ